MRALRRSARSRGVALLAALLAGCGDGGSKPAATQQPPAGPAAQVDLGALERRDLAVRPLAESEALELLRDHEFEELERRLDGVQSSFESGGLDEHAAVNAFAAFHSADAALLEPLDAWVAASSGSYAARAARGLYLEEAGWRARAAAGAPDEGRPLVQPPNELHRSALADLQAAVQARPKLIVGQGEIIRIARGSGDRALASAALARALELHPQSYWVRAQYLEGLRPRWGGSREAMAEFVREAQAQVASNPRLVLLSAREIAEQGDAAREAQDCEGAIRSYTDALHYGPELSALEGRGRCLAELGRDRPALRDFDRFLEIQPRSAAVLVQRARIYRKLASLEKAARDFKQAEALEPVDSWVLDALADDHHAQGRADRAADLYERSLAFAPGDRHALERLVELLPRLGRRADAERYALQLIQLQRR